MRMRTPTLSSRSRSVPHCARASSVPWARTLLVASPPAAVRCSGLHRKTCRQNKVEDESEFLSMADILWHDVSPASGAVNACRLAWPSNPTTPVRALAPRTSPSPHSGDLRKAADCRSAPLGYQYARSLGYRHAVGVLLSVPTDGVEEACDVLWPQRPMVRLAWKTVRCPGRAAGSISNILKIKALLIHASFHPGAPVRGRAWNKARHWSSPGARAARAPGGSQAASII